MSQPREHEDPASPTFWQQYRFFALIALVVTVALFLVSVALSLYNSSGAAQVDLSRPGYESIRDQANQDKNDKSFDSTGTLDEDALKSFDSLYRNRAAKVVGVDSFDAAALSEESLQLLGNGTTSGE